MVKKYYSSRSAKKRISVDELYLRFKNFYLYFEKNGYFNEKAKISPDSFNESMRYDAGIKLGFNFFPVTEWDILNRTESNIFDGLEYLFDYVSKPGPWGLLTSETGGLYYDYDGYNERDGREEYREKANMILSDYGEGFEFSRDGRVVKNGSDGLQYILNADIPEYDEKNVDSHVKHAIDVWRARTATLEDKKAAIRELADVFEWLKKTKNLADVIGESDNKALFEIANRFAIRHHNQKQATEYDKTIWYSWIFHFYLATYHAAIRFLIKQRLKGMGR